MAPFTVTSIRYRWQDRFGLTVVDGYAEWAPHWASLGGWNQSVEIIGTLKRGLIAINDQPLSWVLQIGYEYRTRQEFAKNRQAWQVGWVLAGLSIDFQLRD